MFAFLCIYFVLASEITSKTSQHFIDEYKIKIKMGLQSNRTSNYNVGSASCAVHPNAIYFRQLAFQIIRYCLCNNGSLIVRVQSKK